MAVSCSMSWGRRGRMVLTLAIGDVDWKNEGPACASSSKAEMRDNKAAIVDRRAMSSASR